MGVFQNNLLAGAAAAASAGGGAFYSYQIEQSVRLDRASSSYFSRAIQSGGSTRQWTLSFWFKLTAGAGFGSNEYHVYTADTNVQGSYDVFMFDQSSTSTNFWRIFQPTSSYKAENSFRDSSGWGHLMLVADSPNSDQTLRRRMYFNGTLLSPQSANYPSQNADCSFNANKTHLIGSRQDISSNHFYDGYFAEWHFVDGYSYDASYFGETKNGVWIPKDYYTTTGNYGITGYYLKFENASDLGNDSSGNNNDFTANNMGTDHQVLDSPTFGS